MFCTLLWTLMFKGEPRHSAFFQQDILCLISLYFAILMLVVKESSPSKCIQLHPMGRSLKPSMNMLWNVCWAVPSPRKAWHLQLRMEEAVRPCGRGIPLERPKQYTHTLHSGALCQWAFSQYFLPFWALGLGPWLTEHRKYLSLSKDRWPD